MTKQTAEVTCGPGVVEIDAEIIMAIILRHCRKVQAPDAIRAANTIIAYLTDVFSEPPSQRQ
jgi:hypothetical protein